MSPISPELREKLEGENPQLADVLIDDSCVRAFRSNVETLISYLCKHVEELLDLVLDCNNEEISNLSTKAFTLLSIPNETIFKSLLENNIFFTAVEKVFSQENADLIAVNRLAVITQIGCINYPDNIHLCKFITRFLQYCRYRSVFEMFKAFLTTEDKANVQTFLKEESFPNAILDIIKNTKDLDSNPDSPSVQNLVQVLRLIPMMANSVLCPDLEPVITEPLTIEVLSHQFTPEIQEVLNKQWEAIASVVSEKNYLNVEELSDLFLEKLGNPELPLITPQIESIIKIISKLIKFDKEYYYKLVEWGVGEKLANIVERFPRHTLCNLAITNFALAAVSLKEVPSLFDDVLNPLFKVVSKSFEDGQPIEFRGFGFNFQKSVFQKLNDEGLQPAPPDVLFTSEVRKKIDDLSNIAEKSYGGDLPQPANDEQDEISNLTPDQLISLLRFITGGRR